VRGAVDFVSLGSHRYNVADFFIIGATPLFLLAAAYLAARSAHRPAGLGPVAPTTRRRPRARMRAFAGAVGLVSLVGVVGLGAANHGGVTAPIAAARPADHR
jgi:hypothetical protein